MVRKEEVLEVAKLARLYLDDSELDQFTEEFNAILDYVQTLSEVDTNNVEAMSHVHGIFNVMRDDAVVHTITPEQALSNAPECSGTSIKVPLVIESNE